jgi:DNA-binding XRE family transcriptional regulator
MTPNQYRTALERLGLTQETAAQFLDVSLRTSHGYANGSPIPEATAKLLRLMVRLELSPEDVR